MTTTARKRLLIVAGHDPSGAGIDADREAVRDLPVEALAVVTAWTDQDAHGVRSIGARPPDEWLEEALAHGRRGVDALKLGLLPGPEHVIAAVRLVRELRALLGDDLPVVLDPVIAASSGTRFLDARAVELLREKLIATGVIVTPNLAEAAELAAVPLAPLVGSVEHEAGLTAARLEAARILLARGARAVIVKGGHGAESPARDLVATSAGLVSWSTHARIAGGKVRGSGCRYASRLAARLALGASLADAAEDAARHVRAAIAAVRAGSGST